MNLLLRLTVSRRLALGFGTVVLLIAALTAISGVLLTSARQAVLEVVDDRYPKIDLANDIRDAIDEQAIDLRNGVLALAANDKERAAESFKRAAEARARVDRVLQKLTPLIHLPEGHKRLEAIVATRAEFGRHRDEVMAHIEAGRQAEASALLLGPMRASQKAYFDAVDAMMHFQQELMIQSGEEAKDQAARALQATVAFALAVLVVSVVAGWAIGRSITGELGGEPSAARDAARRVAQGDLSTPVPVRPGDTTTLFAALHEMQQSLARITGQVRTGSESIATASAQIAQANGDLSQRTEQQASALQQTAATMEQLGSTVRHNADSARQANQLAQGAASVAVDGGAVVGDVVTTMKGISDSSRRIGDIIGVIDGIAFQTNILALNAAVEAARAGEQGRGFAVVASEVRALAQRSADAAKEIKALIGSNVEQVERGTALVDRAGRTMQDIVDSIRRVSDLVSEITSATVEQSNGVEQVGSAVSQMDQATQQNAAMVEQSAAAAQSLSEQARQLLQSVSIFRLAQDAPAAGGDAGFAPAAARPGAAVPARDTPAAPVAAAPRRTAAAASASPAPAPAPRVAPVAPAARSAVPPAAKPAEPPRAAAAADTDDWATF